MNIEQIKFYEISVFEMEDLLKYIYLLREKLKY